MNDIDHPISLTSVKRWSILGSKWTDFEVDVFEPGKMGKYKDQSNFDKSSIEG